ncbi:MAG: AMP-binding protein [Nitrosomonadales bacterium]
MNKFTTLSEMIAIHANGTPSAIAITAPSATPLTYQGLNLLVENTVTTLNKLGVGRGDRVGIVMPNCPEMATAFVAIASGCTAAPLNIAYRADEFEFYLSDLKAKALVVAIGNDTPARTIAVKLGIPILELTLTPENGAGSFTLAGADYSGSPITNGGLAQADDIALILHTSGTTSRPKIVPLSHTNVCASARNISATLNLQQADRELHVMPLFHIHGLIAGVLAPLAAGSQIYCTPGFNALKFLDG